MSQTKSTGSPAATADYKVVLLGDSATGKTSLIERYVSGSFKPHQPPTFGASFALKTITFSGIQYKVGIWDTAGQEKYDCLSSFYSRGASAGIVCYSMVDPSCKVEFWIDKLLRESGVPNVTVVLCGTKSDLVGTIGSQWDPDTIREIAHRYHALHFETSSLTGEKVAEMFETTIAHLAQTMPPPRLRAARGVHCSNPADPPRVSSSDASPPSSTSVSSPASPTPSTSSPPVVLDVPSENGARPHGCC